MRQNFSSIHGNVDRIVFLLYRLRENPELENIYKRATENDEVPGPACKKRSSSSTAVAPMSSSTLAYHAAHQFDSLSDEFSESMLRMSGESSYTNFSKFSLKWR